MKAHEDRTNHACRSSSYITDISRQKWAESVQTRNAAAATLAKRRQEEFIDTTSHEMRNPLSAITQLADGIAGSLRDLDGSVPTLEAHKAILQDNVTSANTILACAAHQKRVGQPLDAKAQATHTMPAAKDCHTPPAPTALASVADAFIFRFHYNMR